MGKLLDDLNVSVHYNKQYAPCQFVGKIIRAFEQHVVAAIVM